MKSELPRWWSPLIGMKHLWPLLLPLLFFIPGLSGFPFPSTDAVYSDVAISHYPNALYLRRALAEWGVIPLWSATILSGYPFAANPLSGLWYPPGWLALIFPLPLGFNLLVMLHLLLGVVGLYKFLRLRKLPHQAAIFGSLAFQSMPKLFAHYGAGHLTLVYAVCWTPWLLTCCAEGENSERELSFWGQPGVILALIFLADPRWAPYAGLLWLFYNIAHRQQNGDRPADIIQPSPTDQLKLSKFQLPISKLRYLISNIFISFLLTAPLALPLLEYARLSTRGSMDVSDIFAHSLPPARLLGLFYPDFGGFHEWMLYPGGVVLVLALVSISSDEHRDSVRFWSGVLTLSMLFSMGSNLPLLTWLARVPGFDLLRVPPRALFMAGCAGAILAAHGMDVLIKGRIFGRRVNLWISGVAIFVVVFCLLIGVLTGVWAVNFRWGAGVILFASLWVLLNRREQIPSQIWTLVMFGVAIFDWGAVNVSVLSFRPKEQVISEVSQLGEYLAHKPGRFRVYSPSYSLPQDVAALYNLELVDGVDPMQLAVYADYMDGASGVPRDGYGVTLPAFANGNPSTDNLEFKPDANMLGMLNVAYVVAAYELDVEGLLLLERLETGWVYANKHVMPRAWTQTPDREIGMGAIAVEGLDWRPNQISLLAEGPGMLVLSEIAYPGWRVKIDDQNAELLSPLDLLRGVEIPPGEHEVVFSFRPLSMYLGVGCFTIGLFLMMWMTRSRRNKA